MKQRDIVLVPFPFSDNSGQKIRPALIVSNNNFNQTSDDVVVCAITSNVKPLRYSVIINQNNIESGILHESSAIKIETLFKIQKSLIIKIIGSINKATFEKVIKVLIELTKPY